MEKQWLTLFWGAPKLLLDSITNSMDMSLSELQELVKNREAWRTVIHGVAKSPTRLSNWTELKITADGDCSHEIKRHLFLGRKVVTNLDSIFKSKDITLSTKVHLAKAMVFPVVIYGCESWTVKKAEHLMLLNCVVGEDSWETLGL